MDKAVQKKAAKMAAKTQEMKQAFQLPESESVIQDYVCRMEGSGKLHITQNYAVWSHSNGGEIIPFSKVRQVDANESLLSKAITVTTENNIYNFSGFMHYTEALALLSYLYKHPVSYVTAAEYAPPPPVVASSSTSTSTTMTLQNIRRIVETSPDGSSSSSSSSSKTAASGSMAQKQLTMEEVKVDTEASKDALRRAMEARKLGAETLLELSVQREVMDKIERDVEHIEDDMDRSDRHLRGIESLAGSMANKFSSDPKDRKFEQVDRTPAKLAEKKEAPMEIPILFKHPNDDLSTAILWLGPDNWGCLHPGEKTLSKEFTFKYQDVGKLVMRARPQHMDIRFKGKGNNRFRLMSSYLQLITNEFVLRCGSEAVTILFEPNAREFDYGVKAISDKLGASFVKREAGVAYKETAPTIDSGKAAVLDMGPGASSAKHKVELEEQDRHIDAIADAVGDMKQLAAAIGTTIDEHNDHLDHITERVDDARVRVARANQRQDVLLY